MTIRRFTYLLILLAVSFKVRADFSFYGHPVKSSLQITGIHYNKDLSSSGIQYIQSTIKKADISVVHRQVLSARSEYKLDDVGTILFLAKAVEATTEKNYSQELIKFNVLRQMGYDVILTYTNREMVVFGRLDQKPASSVYLIYDNKRYTNLKFHDRSTAGTRRILKGYDNRGFKAIELSNQSNPNLDARLHKRKIVWTHHGRTYQLDAITNISLTGYLQDIPVMELGQEYVNRACSDQFEHSVLSALKNHLSDFQTTSHKAAFLLSFVQNSFRYKTDEEQFGGEKYNYPEETISYTYSDCEDRTLLLAFLYKRLLGLNSVALYYEHDKHIALAVSIPERSNSYSFTYNHTKYVACEPTGVGFKLGDAGISLERITEVIPL